MTCGLVGVALRDRTYDLFSNEVEVRPIRKRVGAGTCLGDAAWWLSMLAVGSPSLGNSLPWSPGFAPHALSIRATLRAGGAGRSAAVGSLPTSTNAAPAGAACFGLTTSSLMTRSALISETASSCSTVGTPRRGWSRLQPTALR